MVRSAAETKSEKRARAQRYLGSRINKPQERGRRQEYVQTLMSRKCWGTYGCLAGAQPEARLKFTPREGNHVFCREDRHGGSCL